MCLTSSADSGWLTVAAASWHHYKWKCPIWMMSLWHLCLHTETPFTKNPVCPGLVYVMEYSALLPLYLRAVSMWKWLVVDLLKINSSVFSHFPLLFLSADLVYNHICLFLNTCLARFALPAYCRADLQIPGVMSIRPLLYFLSFHYPPTLTWPFQQGSLVGMTDEKGHSLHRVTVIPEILS